MEYDETMETNVAIVTISLLLWRGKTNKKYF